MKVLHIIQRYPPAIGGSEFWCGGVSGFLSKRGVLSKVATINMNEMEEFSQGPPLEDYAWLNQHDCNEDVLVSRYKLWRYWDAGLIGRFIAFLLFKLGLAKTDIGYAFGHSPHSIEMYLDLFKEVKYADIVHLHTLPYFHNIIGFFLARTNKKRIVITPYFHAKHKEFERKIFFDIMKKADAVIALSRYEKDYLTKKGLDPAKITVSGCFCEKDTSEDKEDFTNYKKRLYEKHKIPEDSKNIIFVGLKLLYKGIETLIEAAEEIANEEGINLSLFLVGTDTVEFKKKYPDLKNFGRLKVINFSKPSDKEKDNLIRSSDLLVLPSGFESFGIVFLEAWRSGKPVIGSDRGAIPEVIEGAGLCAKYGQVQDLKDKIKTILFDEVLARELGSAGTKKLREVYSLKGVSRKVFGVYNNVRSNKKKILVVSQLFPPYFIGGSEIVAYEQSKRLKEMNFEMRVFAGKHDNRKRRHRITEENRDFKITRIVLHDVDFDPDFASIDKKTVQEAFRRELYAFAPDVVHFHNIYSLSIKMVDECHKRHIPTVMTLHDFWGICFKNVLLADNGSICDRKDGNCVYCQKRLNLEDGGSINVHDRNRLFLDYLNRLDLLIAPTKYLAQKFCNAGVLEDKVKLIRYGIDTSRFSNIEKKRSKKIRFAYIGSMYAHKGLGLLLKGLSLLSSDEKEKISLSIIGSGEASYIDYCKALIRQMGINRYIRFCGKTPNGKIQHAYRDIDVLIIPSVWPENSPVTILEALAAGTPVLASNVGGIPELVEDGVTGYLYRHDEPLQLARNIRKIIHDPQIIDTMRPACLSKAKENELQDQVDLISREYERITNYEFQK